MLFWNIEKRIWKCEDDRKIRGMENRAGIKIWINAIERDQNKWKISCFKNFLPTGKPPEFAGLTVPKVTILVRWINFMDKGRLSSEGHATWSSFFHYRSVTFGSGSDGAQTVLLSYQIGRQQVSGLCLAWLLTNKMVTPKMMGSNVRKNEYKE